MDAVAADIGHVEHNIAHELPLQHHIPLLHVWIRAVRLYDGDALADAECVR